MSNIPRTKIALIGAGQIGGVLAQLISERGLGDVVLVDIMGDVARGKALDIAEGALVTRSTVNIEGTEDYARIQGAHIVIVTAGLPRKPGMSRDDLIGVNAKIIVSAGTNIKKYAPEAVVIVVSNPMDTMTTLMQHVTQFPKHRVLGQGGVLDSSRFATFLSWELGVAVEDIHSMVFGGHGDTMVPLVDYATVQGVPAMVLLTQKYNGDKTKAQEVMDAIVKRTAGAGGEVVGLLKTGSAFYSPAVSALTMAESIIRDQKRVLPCCVMCETEYNAGGHYTGVAAVLGHGGVESILEVPLSKKEAELLKISIDACKENIQALKTLGFM